MEYFIKKFNILSFFKEKFQYQSRDNSEIYFIAPPTLK